jgi:hypothetical protein
LIIKNLLLGLIFYIGIISVGHFSTMFPDGYARLELSHTLVIHGAVVTPIGPIKYAPLQSFLMAPFYAMGYYHGVVIGQPGQDFTKIGVLFVYYLFLPVVISILCVLFFRLLKRMGVDDNASLASTFLLFCGTFFLPYAGGMFSEALNALLILISFYYFYTAPTDNYISCNRKNFFYLGLLVLNNFVFLFYAGLMMLYVFWNSRGKRNNRSEAWRVALEGSLILGVSVVLFLYYNYSRYGEFLNFGYQGEGFTGNWIVGMYGLLFSFGKGLLVFSPLTVLCLIYFLFKNHEMEAWKRYTISTSLISFVCFLSIYSLWDSWHGGTCWGPRFLLPFVPLIHLMFPMMMKSGSSANKVFRIGVLLAIVWALGMNLLNHLDPSSIFPEGFSTMTSQDFSQSMFIPEESVMFKIWNKGILSLESLRFVATLGLCAFLLWSWKKKFNPVLPVPEPSLSEAS